MNQELLIDLIVPTIINRFGLDKKSISADDLKVKLKDLHETIVNKVGSDKLSKLTACFKINNTIPSIVDVCKSGVDEIMKDGKIDANDSPTFIRMVRNVCSNITNITKDSVSVSVEATDLVELCGFFLKSIIQSTIENPQEQNLANSLITSALELISYKVEGKQIKCGCFGCF